MWKVTCNEFTKPNSLFPVGYYLSYCYKIITKSIFAGFGKGLYRDEVELISHFKSNWKSLMMKQDSVFLFSLLSLFLKIWSFVVNKWPSQPNTALWNNPGERKQLCHFQQGKVIGNSFSSIFWHDRRKLMGCISFKRLSQQPICCYLLINLGLLEDNLRNLFIEINRWFCNNLYHKKMWNNGSTIFFDMP